MDASERSRYESQGFLLLRGLFEADALRRFEDRFVELASGARPAPAGMVVMQDVMVARGVVEPASRIHGVNKILSFEDDPVLFEYALDPALLAAVRALVGPDLMTISTNVFNKPPGIDGRHPLHQDLRYFSLRPPESIVATWTALSRCTRENGCLAVVPGSHQGPLLRHGDPDWEHVNHGFFAADGVDLADRVHFEMEPGDTLLFHPLLLHGSGRNTTDGFRRAISAHFASTDCKRPTGRSARALVVRNIPAA
jgi:phytanoyl-CoA hydroxylase